jgi:hypothetical protein
MARRGHFVEQRKIGAEYAASDARDRWRVSAALSEKRPQHRGCVRSFRRMKRHASVSAAPRVT